MQIQKFNFNGNDIRVLADDHGEPWFVAKDVAEVLGYKHTPHMARMMDPEDITVHKVDRIQRGNPNVKIINESGLYTAIFHSRRPEANQFKRWVTSEVLPSIRKHGGYVVGQEDMSGEELMARAVKFAESKIKELEQKVEEDAPKVDYYHQWMDGEGTVTLTEVGKELFLTPQQMGKWLRKMGIIYKRTDKRIPMKGYEDWFRIIEYVTPKKVIPHMRVTPKGAVEIKKLYMEEVIHG